jgi:hypothetical protein
LWLLKCINSWNRVRIVAFRGCARLLGFETDLIRHLDAVFKAIIAGALAAVLDYDF